MVGNDSLSPLTRISIVFAGALQGLLCYGLARYLDSVALPADNIWLVLVIPATLVVTTTFALSVSSLRQPLLWGAIAAIALAVFGMGAWLKWNMAGLSRWDIHEWLFSWGVHLLLMVMLLLPWLQRRIAPTPGASFYTDFYNNTWHNVLALLLVLAANGVFWLVLFLWASLFRLVGITVFEDVFFDTRWFPAVSLGVVSALGVVLARSQTRLIQAVQKLLTFMVTGFLPLVALLSLSFIAVLPFVGFSGISQRTSAAGLLNCLALTVLLLTTAACSPGRETRPYPVVLRFLIRCSLLITPLYGLLAGWALWLRIEQYGWTVDRLYAVLITLVTLLWATGYCLSALPAQRHSVEIQEKATPAAAGIALLFLLLIHTPLLDPWRISVNSHMTRYETGIVTADRVDLPMLHSAGRRGHEALMQLRQDSAVMADPKRRRQIDALLKPEIIQDKPLTQETLMANIEVAPGVSRPDKTLWTAMMKQHYSLASCLEEKGTCLLTPLDLNGDGAPEWLLFQMAESSLLIYGKTVTGWQWKGQARQLPDGLTKADLLNALARNQLSAVQKRWNDVAIFGEQINVDYLNTDD